MRLADLEAQLIKREFRACHVGMPGCHTTSEHASHEYHVPVGAVWEADGVCFQCPKCKAEHPDGVGVHYVICWRPQVPPDVCPKPGRWEFFGATIDDLTLRAGSSSILLLSGCAAHFFIEGGAIRF